MDHPIVWTIRKIRMEVLVSYMLSFVTILKVKKTIVLMVNLL